MKFAFFCILKLISLFCHPSQSIPIHICEYTGVNTDPVVDIPFSVSNVPPRCDAVTYAAYYFDVTRDDGCMFKKDAAAIKALSDAGKHVYTYFGFSGEEKWSAIMDSTDQAVYDAFMNPFIAKMNELNPTGIILSIRSLYTDIDDFDKKISDFVVKLKTSLPNLQYGLTINGHRDYDLIPVVDAFKYSLTNAVMDLYFIDMHTHDFKCTAELSKSGTPITSADGDVLTLQIISDAISQSALDKSKIIACVLIFPLSPNQFQQYTSYSTYCTTPTAATAVDWCVDKSQKLYDIGNFVKSTFAGISISWIEWDDVTGKCNCQNFPVTNLVFDGWDKKAITPCAQI